MTRVVKTSFKNIREITKKELYKEYESWQTWLLTFRNLSKNTALAYSYDFKYFLNFVALHYELSQINLSQLKELQIKDYRAWISFLNSKLEPANILL